MSRLFKRLLNALQGASKNSAFLEVPYSPRCHSCLSGITPG